MKELKLIFSGKYLAGIIVVGVFGLLNMILLFNRIYWISFIPIGLILIWLSIVQPKLIILFLAFITPFSFNYNFDDLGFSVNLPTEPVLILLILLLVVRYVLKSQNDHEMLLHPLTIAILFNLFWITITSISSSIPLVSFKFLLSRIIYTGIFFFMGYYFFREYKFVKQFIWFFALALFVTVTVILFNHSRFFFAQEWSNSVTYPFFKDHTIYGAILALIIPFMFGFFIKSKALGLSDFERILALIVSVVLIIGLIFSFTRAAWVSVLCALIFLILLLLGFKFKHFMLLAGIGVILLFVFWTRIFMSFSNTQAVSSSDLKAHFESISNVSTDVSNTERINRWNSAIRMYKEKPFLGWGPGTYMFKYAPFQKYREKTAISTDFGTLGNAHSEYLGPLSESGLIGMLSFIAIALIFVYKGIYLFRHASDKKIKWMALLILLSIITYLAHGVMNNFLHTDKASVPFWAFLGMMLALDINNKHQLKSDLNRNSNSNSNSNSNED